MADYKVSDSSLISIANAIRTKGGTSAALSFPDGFVTAIDNISTGGDSTPTPITGSITLSSNSNVISLGKTLSKYIYIIEMSSTSKTTLMGSGTNANRTYSVIGEYPAPSIGNYSGVDVFTTYRVNPTSGVTSYASGTYSNNTSNYISATAIKLPISASVSTAGANNLIDGYTYDYIIIPLE